MCTLTHFVLPQARNKNDSSPLHSRVLRQQDFLPEECLFPRFQVVLAGNAFFHIREISTGRVRGFRGNHNDACALARSLESYS
ncbi:MULTISPECIES: hypothetical protein [unclassified Pseudomonas]|uniref:hypothetical protein n=1 Tax=unclassified Pseudomonas TaxID=196821 RepID=UPI00216056B6|nr:MULTISPECIES: hypothetical protein [unclassified Pseudomonas]UVM52631.1 hypothetical protein LOY38_11650 [Pseudomonas sp. B21-015]WPN60102.1 hypothetical protein QMK51_11070 [Pseudomonas sp. P9_31]